MARTSRIRPGLLLALLAICIVLASAFSSFVWLTAKISPGFSVSKVEATGLQLMPAFAAVVLFGLAAVFVLAYSKTIARRVLCALLIILFGSQLFVVVGDIAVSPKSAMSKTDVLTKVTGISDPGSQLSLLHQTDLSISVWLCSGALLAVIATSLAIAFRRDAWTKTNRRIEKKTPLGNLGEPIDLWDSQA